jgi:LuxR family maltose regulon positive regulatory protein
VECAVAVPQAIALVLDDYHVIETPTIHTGMAFLLDRLPPHVHLLIASRTDPPLPLARLRVRDELTELRAADLRFNSDEATTFLCEGMGLSLSIDEVAMLEARTEGWAAALQLAALSLRGRTEQASFIAAFNGTHRYVVDYLADEVLQRQPQHIQTFLLHTSILDRFSASLCAAVLGGQIGQVSPYSLTDAQVLLEQLERANLFVVPLDDERRWYRYHHLFADFLRERLRTTQPHHVAELHALAAAWFEHNSYATEAITHALVAQDWERAARLIGTLARSMLMRSEILTLRTWLDALPMEVVQAAPALLLADAWLLVLDGALQAAEHRLQMIDGLQHNQEVRDEAAIVRMIIAALQGRPSQNETWQTDLLARFPDNSFLRSVAALAQGYPASFTGDIETAEQAFAEAEKNALASNNLLVALLARCEIGNMYMQQGYLGKASAAYAVAQALVEHRDEQQLPVVGFAYLGLGELARERNELPRALQLLQHGLSLCEKWGAIGVFDGYVSLAMIYMAQGDTASAMTLLNRSFEIARRANIELITALVAVFRVRLMVTQGQVEAVQEWLASPEIQLNAKPESKPGHPYLLYEIEQLARVRALIALGEYATALDVLGWLLRAAETADRLRAMIECLTLQALALASCGERNTALSLLARAIRLAEPEGYVRIFADEGPPLAALLKQLQTKPQLQAPTQYIKQLLGAFQTTVPTASVDKPQLLSERELQVLQLIAAGLSNSEIAEQLVVAQSTVKKHINSIFSKLHVQSRTQALVRARELALLS